MCCQRRQATEPRYKLRNVWMCAWMTPFATGFLMLAEMPMVEGGNVCQKASKMARHQLLEGGDGGSNIAYTWSHYGA